RGGSAKVAVHIHLLEKGLRETGLVTAIVGVWAHQNLDVISKDTLLANLWPPMSALVEGELVDPPTSDVAFTQLHMDFDIRSTPRSQTANRADTASPDDRLLKPAAGRREIAQEPERVEEVRLSGG